MVQKEEIIKLINQNVYYNKEAHANLYRGKTFAIVDPYSKRIEKFKKTKRGAESYIKKEQSFSYYDEYLQDMVTCGNGLIIVEIPASELKNVYSDPYVWYHDLRKNFGQKWYIQNLVKLARDLKVNENVLEFVENKVNEILEEGGFLHQKDYEEIEQNDITADEYKNMESDITDNKMESKDEKTNNIKTGNNAVYKLNDEKNGVEIYFTEKPDHQIRELLKANGFRWSKRGFWYALQHDKTISLAKQLAGEKKANNSENEAFHVSYSNIDINDIDSYVIPEDLQKRENDANWIFRTKPFDWNKDLQLTLQKYQNQVIELLQQTDNEYIKYQLKKSLQYFKKHYYQNLIKRLKNRADCPSWVVTGRAGRNPRKDQKAQNQYDNLMRESIELIKGIEKRIGKYKDMIEREKREELKRQIQEEISNNSVELKFHSKNMEIDYMGYKGKKRVYMYGDYWISKIWGTYRIFKGNKEIHTMKTYESLKDAIRYATYLITKDIEKKHRQAI